MTTSRCTSSRDLNHAVESRQLKKKISASSSRESSPQEDSHGQQPLIDDKPSSNMTYVTEKKMRSRANSVCIQMPDSPSFGLPSETARLLGAGAFVPPERGNVTPSLDHEAKPFNFGTVIPGVYRSSYPQEHDYRFLKSLGLRSIVTLVQKEMPPSFQPFLTTEGIIHHVFDMKGTKKESIPLDTMRGILSVVLDSRHHPLLIHCNHGKHRTGCVVGVVRKLSGWHLSSIHDEYKSYAEPKSRETDLEYIANFNVAHLANMFHKPSMIHAPITLRSRPRHRVVFMTLALAAMIVYYLCFPHSSPVDISLRTE